MRRARRRAALGLACVGLAAAAAFGAAAAEAPARPAPRPTQTPRILPYTSRTGGKYLAFHYAPPGASAPGKADSAAAQEGPAPSGPTPAPAGPALPVVFFSDETSWRPLLEGVASDLSRRGRHVLGIDAPAYFKMVVDGPAYAADLEYFRAFLNQKAQRPATAPVLVAGMGFSAELVPYVLNRAGARGVAGLLLIAPDETGATIYRASVALGMASPPGETFDVTPEFARLPALPVALLQGTLDKKGTAHAFLSLLKGPKRLVSVPGGEHEFRGQRDLLFAHVDDTLRWLDRIAQP